MLDAGLTGFEVKRVQHKVLYENDPIDPRGVSDIVCTRQFIGARRGVLRPRRIILISPKFLRLLQAENVKGAKCEVVHLV